MRTRHLLLILAAAGLVGGCGSSNKSGSSAATTAAGAATTAAAGGGAATVNVELNDTKGTDAPMTMVVSSSSAPAGKVTFVVKNTGTVDHEMVALKTDSAVDKLAVGSDDKVSESASVGETGDPALKPGETRTITLDMSSGSYVLVCNIAKHYGLGMRAAFKSS
jgi:uncharacterized cupredoxin-like copper-binding protein